MINALTSATCTVAAGYLAFRLYKRNEKDDPPPPPPPAWYPVEDKGGSARGENTALTRSIYKEQRRQENIPLLAMKKPMYDNIRMLDPQGTLLCTIGKKKANWYIKRKLAQWRDPEQQTTLQLLFEPSHRSNQSHRNSKGCKARQRRN